MEPIDPLEFGRRVRERREELKKGQKWLAKQVGLRSQQQIGWIEQGKPKKAGRYATEIAEALWTTREWLCWERGPKEARPTVLSPEAFLELYSSLPREMRRELSERAIEAARKIA